MVILTKFKHARAVWALCSASTCSPEYMLQPVVIGTWHWLVCSSWFGDHLWMSTGVALRSTSWLRSQLIASWLAGVLVSRTRLADFLIHVLVDWLPVGFWGVGRIWLCRGGYLPRLKTCCSVDVFFTISNCRLPLWLGSSVTSISEVELWFNGDSGL